ncbi:uncharacterized protein LOC130824393 isoform X2 [Amaranthus tricolor]|uniref:uncharacterized protein LOC130824393 isoform X2 n=1 Tax=Amaranthus tricolor TaxID=29722 RepID=UPI00258AA97D|nr:uncharacterized protein LOC130824393 isoform X2 [Amaranthus tricolor]XP_057545368.1 uncharacterized protein LOC130824393 isoform X2 [Amaranthus tricolor]XP_057545369.1 uncharacterized protein LOC130824393 isoform X2 [Amaranthus tricolor]XP_057545370.1 uncharacterized protein LOC130824393 isoform X2 [Amaranthus tricolor]
MATMATQHHFLSFSPSYSFQTPSLHFFRPHNSLHFRNSFQTNIPNQQYASSSTSFRAKSMSSSLPASYKISGTDTGDPELRTVLELATNSELFEIEEILFGPSYLSPLLKSMTSVVEFDHFMIEEDTKERDHFIQILESRFLYLAADARSTLRGWRPSYRNVLLDVRKELKISCSTKLSTEDLEVEIFIHLLKECSRDSDTAAAIRTGTAELCSMLLKGGQLISLLKISELVSTRLSGKILTEAAVHKLNKEVVKKGVTRAASNLFGFQSLSAFIGPVVWGTFLADIVIQMLGTDYIRILQAINVFSQIRILRRHGLHLDRLKAKI